jgi:hypothetical protein
LLNIQLEEAILMAAEELDSECVNDLIRKEFIGKYYTVKGFKTDRYIISESVDLLMKTDAGEMIDLKEIIKTELDPHFDSVLKTLKEAEPADETEVF